MNKIQLPRDGVEYAHFTFSSVPAGAVFEAQVSGSAWTAIDMTGGALPRLLLRGPDAGVGTGLVVTASGEIRARVKDTPEIIVRGAGYIALVS